MDLLDEVVTDKIENPGQPPLLLFCSQLPDLNEGVGRLENIALILADQNSIEVKQNNHQQMCYNLRIWTASEDTLLEVPWDPVLQKIILYDEQVRDRNLIIIVVMSAMTLSLLIQQKFIEVFKGDEIAETTLACMHRLQLSQEKLIRWQSQIHAAGDTGQPVRNSSHQTLAHTGIMEDKRGPDGNYHHSRTSTVECRALVQHQPTHGHAVVVMGKQDDFPALLTTTPAGVRTS